jgi:oligoendopeptidase F
MIPRKDIKISDSWDLSPLFHEVSETSLARGKVREYLEEVRPFPGSLGRSAARVREAFDLYFKTFRELERIYTFAQLRSDEDKSNTDNLALLEQAIALYTKAATEWSFLTPELLSLPDNKIEEFRVSSELGDYRRNFEEIVRYKPHTLSAVEERLLSSAGEVLSSADRIFSQLNNVDLKFGELGADRRPLTHGTFSIYLKSKDRAVREQAFNQYYQEFDDHKNTIATTLSLSIKRDIFLGKIKNYKNARARALFAENLQEDVYDNLVSTVSDSLGVLHGYYQLRREKLGLKESFLYDTYVPLVEEIEREHSFDEAAELICAALAPLGEEYVAVLRRGFFDERWVDRYENIGKRSGAYSSGCYDSPPYMLMNYHPNNFHDIFTLAHEAGHSMHTYFANKNQPYHHHDYTIFTAEVASTVNEQLLMNYLRKKFAGDKTMTAYLVNQHVDDIKSTLFRQTMFAEFEQEIHATAERDEPITLDTFRGLYRGLLEKYFGPAVTIREIDELECLRIPHFYSAFYVFKYATGLSAAIDISARILDGEKNSVENYLGFLRSGGSRYPLELLQLAGVDLSKPAPIKSAMTKFGELVAELRALV